MKDLAWLKTKQDVTQKNFGMVGMGYVVEVWNEQQAIIKQLESEKAALAARLAEKENMIRVILENGLGEEDLNYTLDGHAIGEIVPTTKDKLKIAVEALKEMPCMCPEALGCSKGDKCLVCTTIATIEGKK